MSKDSNKKQKGKMNFFEYLAVKGDISCDVLQGDLHVEIRGVNTIYLRGCRRIIKYSPDEMQIAAKGVDVSIKGERLVCSSYHDGAVCINGKIDSVNYEDRRSEI